MGTFSIFTMTNPSPRGQSTLVLIMVGKGPSGEAIVE